MTGPRNKFLVGSGGRLAIKLLAMKPSISMCGKTNKKEAASIKSYAIMEKNITNEEGVEPFGFVDAQDNNDDDND